MPASRTEPIVFSPDGRTLEFALAELDGIGASGGGAVPDHERRAALGTYVRAPAERRHPRMRHAYGALSFADLQWSSGRARVAAPPPMRHPRAAPDPGAATDVPALAVENAGGLVHAGSIFLEPARSRGDARIVLASLADAARTRPHDVAAVRGRLARVRDDRFVALATAFQNCGAFVDVPAGVAPAAPLQLVWTGAPGEAQALFPQTIVRVGAGARVTIVERHVGNVDAFVCGTVEVDVAAGAHVDYVVVQQIDDGARLLVKRAARCATGASIAWHVADLGGALVRSNVATELAGDRASCATHAFAFARGFANVDARASAIHAGARTSSTAIVRAAASDRGAARFAGEIAIDRDAAGADASYRCDGLVLSRDAYLEVLPALEIDTGACAARHAATVGTLDAEQLFYVRARGIARGAAERMLALAFFETAIARFPGEALRDEVRTLLDGRLDEIGETFAS